MSTIISTFTLISAHHNFFLLPPPWPSPSWSSSWSQSSSPGQSSPGCHIVHSNCPLHVKMNIDGVSFDMKLSLFTIHGWAQTTYNFSHFVKFSAFAKYSCGMVYREMNLSRAAFLETCEVWSRPAADLFQRDVHDWSASGMFTQWLWSTIMVCTDWWMLMEPKHILHYYTIHIYTIHMHICSRLTNKEAMEFRWIFWARLKAMYPSSAPSRELGTKCWDDGWTWSRHCLFPSVSHFFKMLQSICCLWSFNFL